MTVRELRDILDNMIARGYGHNEVKMVHYELDNICKPEDVSKDVKIVECYSGIECVDFGDDNTVNLTPEP